MEFANTPATTEIRKDIRSFMTITPFRARIGDGSEKIIARLRTNVHLHLFSSMLFLTQMIILEASNAHNTTCKRRR
jgi:hypothetical protein